MHTYVQRSISIFLAIIMFFSLSAFPEFASEVTQITLSTQEITPDTTSLEVNISSLPSVGILRVIELDSDESYNSDSLNTYTCLNFSLPKNLTLGENILHLSQAPTIGKKILVVLRDGSNPEIKDYISNSILITGSPSSGKTPDEILNNCTVTFMKNGKPRTDSFTQAENSVDIQVQLDDTINYCYLNIYAYAGNTTFDPDSSYNKMLWSGKVKNGVVQTCSFDSSKLPLPVGYKIIASLNVPVSEDFYQPSNSVPLEVVDEDGQGFKDYNYPDATIDETSLNAGATSLHISVNGDERLFEAAKNGKTKIHVSVAQYPADQAFDFESRDQISLLSLLEIKEPLNGYEISFPDHPLRPGYRVRAVVFWEQNKDLFLPKGNDYEAIFHCIDDSVIISSSPCVSINNVTTADSDIQMNVSGDIPQNTILILKSYDATATKFDLSGGTLIKTLTSIAPGRLSVSCQQLEPDKNLVAFLLNDGKIIAQSSPASVASVPDFKISLRKPVTPQSQSADFTITSTAPDISNINIIQLCKLLPDGSADTVHPVARIYGQKPGTITFDLSNVSLTQGDKFCLYLTYLNGEKTFISETFSVIAPVKENSLVLQETSFTTDSDTATVTISGCDTFKGGYLFLSTGSSATNDDGDSRIKLCTKKFTGEGTYSCNFDPKELKSGNTLQAYLYKYDPDTDGTFYKYSNPVVITPGSAPAVSKSIAIVTDTIQADRTDLWITANFDASLEASLKLYTYTNEPFDISNATAIYSGTVFPSASSQKVSFGTGNLHPGQHLIAILAFNDHTSIMSSSKIVTAAPEKIKPSVSIITDKVTPGMTSIKARSDFDAKASSVSYRLYQFNGETLDQANDPVLCQGVLYYTSRSNIILPCSGKLTAGSRLQLVLTVDNESVLSNIVTIQPAPDWGMPYAAFEVSAVKDNAGSIDVSIDYSDEYLSLGNDFYCDVTIYEFPGTYSDQTFKDNEMWEQLTTVTRVAQINSRFGNITKGHLEIPLKKNITLTPGDRLIIKLRLPHTEWEGEEVDYLSASVPVISSDQSLPSPKIIVYNMSSDTSIGSRLRDISKELDLPVEDITTSQLNEKVGYLAGLQNYTAAKETYTGSGSDIQFMLMCNMSESLLDRFLAAMKDAGIHIDHKAVTTAYNIDYEFHRLIDDIADEHEIFQSLIQLNSLVQKGKELSSKAYGSADNWNTFQSALIYADKVLSIEDPALKDIQDAISTLKTEYLLLTNMTELTGNAVISMIPDEKGTYTLKASVINAPSDVLYSYSWSNGAKSQEITDIPADHLLGISVKITAQNKLGELTGQLQVPKAPAATISADSSSLTISWDAISDQSNCPAPDSFILELFKNNVLIRKLQVPGNQHSAVISALNSDTEYTINIYSYNVIGRSDIISLTDKTRLPGRSTGSGTYSGNSGSDSSHKKHSSNTVNSNSDTTADNTVLTSDDQSSTASPAPDVSVSLPFTDVPKDSWSLEAIRYVYKKGLFGGTSQNSFSPKAPITREQMWMVLARMNGTAPKSMEESRIWVIKNHISDGTHSNNALTREQLITLLWRLSGRTIKTDSLAQYDDFSDVSAYAVDAMRWAVNNGLIKGSSATKLNPKAIATREQVAAILQRINK